MYAPSGVIRSVGMTVVKFIAANKKTLRLEGSASGSGLRPGSGDAPAPLAAPGPPAAGRMRHVRQGRGHARPAQPLSGGIALRAPSLPLTLVLGDDDFIAVVNAPSKKILAVG